MIGLLFGAVWPLLAVIVISLISGWWRFIRRESWEVDVRGRRR